MSKGENMKSGDILLLTIKDVRLHKEERMIQGAQYGSYSSDYIAQFVEYPMVLQLWIALQQQRIQIGKRRQRKEQIF